VVQSDGESQTLDDLRCQPAPTASSSATATMKLVPSGTVSRRCAGTSAACAPALTAHATKMTSTSDIAPPAGTACGDRVRVIAGLEVVMTVLATPDRPVLHRPTRSWFTAIGKSSGSWSANHHMPTSNSHVSGLALAAPHASPDTAREIDRVAVQHAARDLLRALGADIDADGLQDTPRRMADAYAELLTAQPFRATTFPNDDGYDQLIVAGAIPFHSLCMHHLLPFHGVAHIGYLPGERIIGLSKLGRVVELFARDLQVQERMTTQIADWLQRELEPRGVGVVLEAEHMCMSLRGVQKLGSRTVTSALQGLVRDDPRTRQEFLALTTRTSA
jgi:GTP cyclohydrolase I